MQSEVPLAARDRKQSAQQAMTEGTNGPGTAASGSRPKPMVRCFIATSARVDLTPIRDLFEERGIVAVLAHEAAASGMTIVAHVTALIAESDLFLALLDQGQSSANVTFELGYAYALNKKILVILSPEAALPADLTTVFSIRATLDNREALAFALDQLLAAPSEPHRAPVVRLAAGRPIDALADDLVARVDEAVTSGDPTALEQIVLEAIRAGEPAVVVDVPNGNGGRPDLAVWSDDLETWVGNPLLIEVKLRLSASAAELIRRQMQSYIELTNSRWALVLYADGPSPPDDAPLSSPPVMFMRLDDFLRSLQSRSLAETVRALHNVAVHGVTSVHGR